MNAVVREVILPIDISVCIPLNEKKVLNGKVLVNSQEVKAQISIDSLDSTLSFTLSNTPRFEKNYVFEFIGENSEKFFLFCMSGKNGFFPSAYGATSCKYTMHISKIMQHDVVHDKFSGAIFILSGVGQWLDGNTLSALFSFKKNKYQVNSKVIKLGGRDFIALEVASLEEVVTADELEDILFKFKVLFSLLIGSSVSIDFSWLTNQLNTPISFFFKIGDNQKTEPFQFDSYEHIIKAVIACDHIKGRLGVIIENFFADSNEIFAEVATRVVSLFSYNSYWDVEFSYYLMLIEGCASQKLRGEDVKHLKFPKTFIGKIKYLFSQKVDHLELYDTFIKKIKYLLKALLVSKSVERFLKLNGQKRKDFIGELRHYRDNYAHCNFRQLSENLNEAIKFHSRVRQLLILILYAEMGLDVENLLISFHPYLGKKNLMKEYCDDFFDMNEIAKKASI